MSIYIEQTEIIQNSLNKPKESGSLLVWKKLLGALCYPSLHLSLKNIKATKAFWSREKPFPIFPWLAKSANHAFAGSIPWEKCGSDSNCRFLQIESPHLDYAAVQFFQGARKHDFPPNASSFDSRRHPPKCRKRFTIPRAGKWSLRLAEQTELW